MIDGDRPHHRHSFARSDPFDKIVPQTLRAADHARLVLASVHVRILPHSCVVRTTTLRDGLGGPALTDQTVQATLTLPVTPVGSDPDGDMLHWSGQKLPAGAYLLRADAPGAHAMRKMMRVE